jgi:hypothetical protein
MEKSLDRRSYAGLQPVALQFIALQFIVLLGVLALEACTPPDASAPPAAAAAPAGLRSYRYAGLAGSSEVTQEKVGDGREALRGSTELEVPGSGVSGSGGEKGAAARSLTLEAATLDAHGRLERAEIVVKRSGRSEVRYTLDASRGVVHIERAGSAPLDWQVPVDAPWLYSPDAYSLNDSGSAASASAASASGDATGDAADRDEGELLVTPVGAWVALRAASAGDVVRVLEPAHQRSYLTTVDQIAVPTEQGTTIALGYDGVDADARFITELRLFHGSVTLARLAAVDLGV